MRDEAEHKSDSEAVGFGARRCRDAEGVKEVERALELAERGRGYDLSMATSAEPRVFASIEDAIEDVRNGKFVVVDDPNRENEGDLVVAAQFAMPEAITFMRKREKLGQRLHHQDLKFEPDTE